MDIDLFSDMVKGLILDNDEVTLPGLGTFVSEVMPSTFSDKGYTINPPYRKLSFRQRGSGNEEMLADFYAEINGTDLETSKRILGEFIAGLRTTLQAKKVVIFPGLGRLRATKENTFFFIADEDLDIYRYGVGLEPVSLKTHEETPDEVAQSVAALRELVADPAPVRDSIVPVTLTGSVTEEEGSLTGETGSENMKDVPVADAIEETVPVASTALATDTTASVTETEGSVTEVTSVVTEAGGSGVEGKNTVPDKIVVETEKTEKTEETSAATGRSDTGDEKTGNEETSHKTKKSAWRVALIVSASLLALALVALGIFILLVHVAPDFIDSILYTPEELRIINH